MLASRLKLVLAACLVAGCSSQEPQIARIIPAQGDIRGGQLVRIEGHGFVGRGPVEVFFGQKAAKAVTIEGARLITAVSPVPDDSGPVQIQLRFAEGELMPVPQEFVYKTVPGLKIERTPLGTRSVPDTSSSE